MDGVRNGAAPFGVDTIVLRMDRPVAGPAGYDGRMWRMRPGYGGRVGVGAVWLAGLAGPVARPGASAGAELNNRGMSLVHAEPGGLHDISVPECARPVRYVPSGPVPSLLPLLFIPGTHENKRFVRSTISGF